MPRTRHSASGAPKSPSESRLATMRAASAGPIPESDSSSAAVARSMSTGARLSALGFGLSALGFGLSALGVGLPALGLARLGFVTPRAALAESTRASWRSRPVSGARSGRRLRTSRTALPDSATTARNQRARRSFSVGTPY